VTGFLSRWLVEGFASSEAPEPFVAVWGAMIAHAAESPRWQPRGQWRSGLGDLWIELLALGVSGEMIAEREDTAGARLALIPFYERWAAEWLGDARSAGAFCQFIVRPGSRHLLLPGVRWLHPRVRNIDRRRWDDYHVGGALAAACRRCWQQHRRELEQDAELRAALLGLLALLVEREEPEGLTLRDEVVRSSTGG
jgi:hypothetical protein